MTDGRCNYHHGDLRNALIIAAAELIERDGTLDFQWLSSRGGPASALQRPYRHFADKEELLRAVQAAGHSRTGPRPPKPPRNTPCWLV